MKNYKISKAGFGAFPAIVALLGVLGIGMARADGTVTQSSSGFGYVLEDIKGNVQVQEEGNKDWETAQEGQLLDSGDEVKVGGNSEATLLLDNETAVHLSAQTDMKVNQIQANSSGGFLSRLQVFAGGLLADVKKHLEESHSSFEVESNGIVCGVRGTAFEVTAQGDSAEVATHEGAVDVGNGTETHRVEAGNFSSFHKGFFQTQGKLAGDSIEKFRKWREFVEIVRKKRLQRLEDIRLHRRAAWVRKHPQLGKYQIRRQWRQRHRHWDRER